MPRPLLSLPVVLSFAAPIMLSAQSPATNHAMMDHAAHQRQMQQPARLPTLPGQAAFGAISEIVAILKADSTTDWSKVNIEALRQHLIDMDAVTMRAAVTQHPVPGGFEADVTGDEKTMAAIRRMLGSHTRMLSQGTEYRATAAEITGGARLTVVAADPGDTALVTRIRGLGFAGMLTEGSHHVRHHLALARGDMAAHEH